MYKCVGVYRVMMRQCICRYYEVLRMWWWWWRLTLRAAVMVSSREGSLAITHQPSAGECFMIGHQLLFFPHLALGYRWGSEFSKFIV